jgi:hypothetical protein
MIGGVFPLEDWQKAFAQVEEKKVVKAVFEM